MILALSVDLTEINLRSDLDMGHNWTLAVPNLILPNFGKFLKNHLAANLILQGIWGKMAPGRARVSAPGRVREGDAKLVR